MALWRVEQAAEFLGIRPKTLYEWVRLGRVPHRKIGFNVRFDPAELEKWTAAQSRVSSQPAPRRGKPETGEDPPGASAALQRLAADASRVLRELERDVGANLSYPQRRELSDLVERLEGAAASADEDG
jgi:excisionase family DNA binding protein